MVLGVLFWLGGLLVNMLPCRVVAVLPPVLQQGSPKAHPKWCKSDCAVAEPAKRKVQELVPISGIRTRSGQ